MKWTNIDVVDVAWIMFFGTLYLLALLALLCEDSSADRVCAECGFTEATDYQVFGSKVKCDGTTIIDTHPVSKHDKWGDERLTYSVTSDCQAVQP